jgi:hypothetical protein
MTTFKVFASLVLATAVVSTLTAETHCPANVASLPFQVVNRHLIILPVSINHVGPYDFLLDTGAQRTTLDPALGAELHLEIKGQAMVEGIGSRQSVSFAYLDLLQAGSHAVSNQRVNVSDLSGLQSAGLRIRGILAEDFLEQFDLLIDYAHNLLCLDDTGAMRASVKGTHIALVAGPEAPEGAALPKLLVVEAYLSEATRPVQLMLDSGANIPFLYRPSDYMAAESKRDAALHGSGLNGAQQAFWALPPRNVKIGSVELPGLSFRTTAVAPTHHRDTDVDGLLAMGLFRRIFIDHADKFVVLEP